MNTPYASIPVALSILKNIPYFSCFYDIQINNTLFIQRRQGLAESLSAQPMIRYSLPGARKISWVYEWKNPSFQAGLLEFLHDLLNPIRACHKLLKALYHLVDLPFRVVSDLSLMLSEGLTLFLPVVFMVALFSIVPWLATSALLYQCLYLTLLDPLLLGDEHSLWSFWDLNLWGSSYSALYSVSDSLYQALLSIVGISPQIKRTDMRREKIHWGAERPRASLFLTDLEEQGQTLPPLIETGALPLVWDKKEDISYQLVGRTMLGCSVHSRLVI